MDNLQVYSGRRFLFGYETGELHLLNNERSYRVAGVPLLLYRRVA